MITIWHTYHRDKIILINYTIRLIYLFLETCVMNYDYVTIQGESDHHEYHIVYYSK